MRPQGPALLWCPFGDEDSAAEVIGRLLDEGLIACANLLPGSRSLYVWRGQRHDTRECCALMKTDAALLTRASTRLAELHPYETPAVVGWRIDMASAATSEWLGQLAKSQS